MEEYMQSKNWWLHRFDIDDECYQPVTSSIVETATVTTTTMNENDESYVFVGGAGGTENAAGNHAEFL